MGPMYTTVDMQSTAEQKQQATQDQPLGGSVLDTRPLRARYIRTYMAERDFHVILMAVFRLVGV